MHLKKIKLSGFKSFVDPTVVMVPSNLVAVVGPNGCGKSNIIDAVCWVMGESSAKYLRGESLTDVIFNGSTTRKPVGLASVELIFDNQDGSLGGEYASYGEISIRRQITREGDSSYFLNGTRCRRKDIIDIFLGTGLGPRSYSIIGQNMISRIIEAKPEEMRVYLEEAAGVSKYKERRRETENRINHTKENLARLSDLRLELEKQLNSLKRQANAAEKFKLLKQDERILRAQWLAIQWRHLDARLVQSSLQIQHQETGLESKHADISEVNVKLEAKRESQRIFGENFQEIQRRYYKTGNEITRIEQEIRHTQERQNQWKLDIDQTQQDWNQANTSLEQMQNEMTDLQQEIIHLEPALNTAVTEARQSIEQANKAEQDMQAWQTRWDEFNQQSAKSTQVAQVEQTRIQHLEQKLAALKQRQEKLLQEQDQISFSELESNLTTLSEQETEAAAETERHQQALLNARESIQSLQASYQQLIQELDQLKHQMQRLSGQQASLEALQQTALGQKNNPVTQWLAKHDLDKKPRLAQGIEVEAGWEYAVEKVLGSHLQAICVEGMDSLVPIVEQFKSGHLCAFSTKANSSQNHSSGLVSLLSKIKSDWNLDSLLSGIYIAPSLTEALALASTLQAHESVITADGTWLSAAWIRIWRDEKPEAGIFQREQELKQLAKQIAEAETKRASLEKVIAETKEKIQQAEMARDELQSAANQAHARKAEIHANQKVQQQRLTELKSRLDRMQKEQAETTQQLNQTQSDLTKSRTVWQTAMSELEHHAEERDKLTQQRDQLRLHLQTIRQQSSQAKEHAHQQEIKLETTRSQENSLRQNAQRLQSQLKTLEERKATLEKELSAVSSLTNLESELETMLKERLVVEQELNESRSQVDGVEQELKALEVRRQEIEREIAKYRDVLETLRVEGQGLKVKSETLQEQIQEADFVLTEILQQLPEEATIEEYHGRLEEVTQRISRLGPINLVAIEEYASCSERKDYLDSQNADLQEGLATLEDAIAKIDKETRARFKETFDKVNERFQELFPKIFGGGRAYLELTGESLLDAGIAVMACPPGKRNSTIHLLSGGEKAMTAISLVFSIFHLNPAPFCLLDEVDAPLDDANIGRFCQLVKAMSEKTQFIFISHNKLAIEMGEHLMGVTMHEPGVSRLVSVNVEEAVSLAGA